MRLRRSPLWTIVVILAVAVAARLYGVSWGLPHAYEEAQPLKIAWQMWGWGPDESFDLNPHFYNYPPLTFYVQLGGQAFLYAAMRTLGSVRSTEDFRVRYYAEPTPFYVLGRLFNVACGVITVLLLYGFGRYAFGRGPDPTADSANRRTAAVASLLLAVNLHHVARSQMIEVDVPLTLFVVGTLVALWRLIEAPTRGRYALAGAALGLAAATKYTGALLAVPLVAAHLIARRSADPRPGWKPLAIAGAAGAAVFLAVSPFTLADFGRFWHDLSAERSHMRLGHFGLGGEPAYVYYPLALGRRLAGWPAVALALVGFVHSLFVRRELWSIVVAAFVVPYALAISSWAMMADRYALPLLPFVFLYAAAGLRFAVGTIPGRTGWRTAAAAAGMVALLAPVALALPRHLDRYGVDSRTRCLEWLEVNVPAGSFVVSEAYGPPIAGPVEYWSWPGDIRDRIYSARGKRPFYSYFQIPIFQVEADQVSAFYHVGLYREADVLITTGSVRSRYARQPDRFTDQIAFYRALGVEYERAGHFEPGGTGATIDIYRPRAERPPFSDRPVEPPPPILPRRALRPHWQGTYYYRMAVNYEAWNHLPEAITGYETALPFTWNDSELYREVVYGMIRCLALTGERERALAFIDRVKGTAPTPDDRRFVDRLQSGVLRYQPGNR